MRGDQARGKKNILVTIKGATIFEPSNIGDDPNIEANNNL